MKEIDGSDTKNVGGLKRKKPEKNLAEPFGRDCWLRLWGNKNAINGRCRGIERQN